MDWDRYRALCDSPQYFTRWMIERSALLVDDAALRSAVCEALMGTPLRKPAGHKGGVATDMFGMTLTVEQAGRVLAAVRLAADAGRTTSEGRGLGGFVAAWNEYDAHLRTHGRDSMSAQDRVTAMIDAFNRMDLDGIVACFAEDAVYHNIPMEPVQGTAAIRAVLEGFMGAATEVEWEVLNSVSNGGTVLNERVDKFKVNGTWIALPVMGTFEVTNDRITAWRDYFDLNQFQTQMQAAMG